MSALQKVKDILGKARDTLDYDKTTPGIQLGVAPRINELVKKNSLLSAITPTIAQISKDTARAVPAAVRLSPAGQAYQYLKGRNTMTAPSFGSQASDLFQALKPIGYRFNPLATAAGGAINVGMQGVVNKWQGKPFLNNAPQSFAQGTSQAAALGPISRVNPLFKSQVSGPFVGAISQYPIAARVGMNAIREGVEGAVQGAIEPLPQGKNRLQNIGEQALFGTILGGTVQGAGDSVSLAKEKVIKKVAMQLSQLYPQLPLPEARKRAVDFLRDELGRFAGRKKGETEPVFYGDLRESLGLPRNGDYQKGAIDLGAEVGPSKKSVPPVSQEQKQPQQTLLETKSSMQATATNPAVDLKNRKAQTMSLLQLQQERQGLQAQPLQTSIPLQKAQSKSFDEILQQAKKEIQKQPEKKQTLKAAWDRFYTDYVNRMQPVEDLVSGVQKKMNSSIRPEFNPKYQITKLLGAGGSAELRHKKELDPIIRELGKTDKSDFDVYLKARRDIELATRDIKGSDAQLAQQRIDALGTKYDLGKFNDVATKLYAYQDKGLRRLVEAGFIDEPTYNNIKGKNEAYVPFQRVMDEVDNYLDIPTKKLSQGKQPVNKIAGSDKAIYSPLESIIANTYKLEGAIAKNNVAKSIANLSTINPNLSDIIKKVDSATKNTIPVWVNGKKEFYEVPEDINRVVKGLNEEQVGQVVKLLSIPANLLRQGATGRNVDFMVPNVVKDQFDAAVSSKYGYRPFIDYFNGLGEMIKAGMGKPNFYDEYAANGGKIFYEMAGGRKAIAKEIQDATKQKGLGAKFFNTITDGLDFLGKISETPTRVGLYKKALQGSKNKLIAANEAREGTLDFARMGAKMKTANSIIPFLNVGVQGFDKLIRSARDNPGKMLFYGALYGIAPQVALTIWNNTQHPEEYQEISDEVKQDNFVLVRGRKKNGKVDYITLSKGNILPYITNPVDNLLSAVAGYDRQTFSSLATTLLGEALPIIEPGRDINQTASRSLGAVVPQAFKPALENVANYNFYKGKEIVPSYLKNKSPVDQSYDSTPLPYKYIGNLLQVSPLKVQNALEGYFAGFVKTPLQIASILQKISRNEKLSPNEIPVLRRFFSETYDTGKQFQEKKQKEEKKALDREKAKENIAPLNKRLFGEVSAAEEGQTLKSAIEKNELRLKALKEYKDMAKGEVKIQNPDKYFTDTYGVSTKDLSLSVIRSLDRNDQAKEVLKLLRGKDFTAQDLDNIITQKVLTTDIARAMANNGLVTPDQYKTLNSYIKRKTDLPKAYATRKSKKGKKFKTPKAPKIKLSSFRLKKAKGLTLKDLYAKRKTR